MSIRDFFWAVIGGRASYPDKLYAFANTEFGISSPLLRQALIILWKRNLGFETIGIDETGAYKRTDDEDESLVDLGDSEGNIEGDVERIYEDICGDMRKFKTFAYNSYFDLETDFSDMLTAWVLRFEGNVEGVLPNFTRTEYHEALKKAECDTEFDLVFLQSAESPSRFLYLLSIRETLLSYYNDNVNCIAELPGPILSNRRKNGLARYEGLVEGIIGNAHILDNSYLDQNLLFVCKNFRNLLDFAATDIRPIGFGYMSPEMRAEIEETRKIIEGLKGPK